MQLIIKNRAVFDIEFFESDYHDPHLMGIAVYVRCWVYYLHFRYDGSMWIESPFSEFDMAPNEYEVIMSPAEHESFESGRRGDDRKLWYDVAFELGSDVRDAVIPIRVV